MKKILLFGLLIMSFTVCKAQQRSRFNIDERPLLVTIGGTVNIPGGGERTGNFNSGFGARIALERSLGFGSAITFSTAFNDFNVSSISFNTPNIQTVPVLIGYKNYLNKGSFFTIDGGAAMTTFNRFLVSTIETGIQVSAGIGYLGTLKNKKYIEFSLKYNYSFYEVEDPLQYVTIGISFGFRVDKSRRQ